MFDTPPARPVLRFAPSVLRAVAVSVRPVQYVLALAILLATVAPGAKAQMVIEARADIVSIRALGVDTAASFLMQEKITIQLAELSTISALEAVADGRATMALSARDMHAANSKEQGLVFVPIAWEAIVAITHPGNPVGNISLRDLREIYAGRIRNWEQIGGRPGPIHLNAVAGPTDGIEYGLRKALFGRGNIPIAAERWYLNTAQLEASIAIDPNGLAVTGLSNALNNPKLKRLHLEGVPATRSNLKQGEYLLATPIYVVHRAGEGSTSPVGRYLRFLRTDRPSRLAMQRKKLLPIREADMLNEIFAGREQKLLAMLETPAPLPLAAAAAATPAALVPPVAATPVGTAAEPAVKTAEQLP
jgi:phosphate transport system substrate-binding protein